jgi:GntR family transcriptional regulator, carbon starvation induced regulator
MTVRSRTLETYQALRQDLLNGRFIPGAKLKIEALCRELEVSPGAVREALARLTSDGLVVSEAQRGFYVTPISVEDLKDLTEVRIEIELRCLRRSIANGNLAWEGRIKDVWHQFQYTPASDPNGSEQVNPAWTELHAAFHDALVHACDSRWWLKLRDSMFWQVERYRRMAVPFMKTPRHVDAEHAEIVEAVLARDTELACARLEAHLRKTSELLLCLDGSLEVLLSKAANTAKNTVPQA